ncbi:hypothetical protein J5N97_007034 [Dioscorea zingiberensis]|uniref:RNase H type-1 domain-containing protein n=1 Tax=Dioscorea zingiberensis TaxID=325984 RepID=A0A9D5DB35_9LILI|nr:hypothetical protein J5N97_007034 [Dioscorea zingiberensis]
MIRQCLSSSHCRYIFLLRRQFSTKTRIKSYSWRKPEPGFIKLNFDGTSKDEAQNASIGGVYRNHEGVFMLGYAEHIGRGTSSVAELVAAKRGLELALENEWLDLCIEGDAKAVVDLLSNKIVLKSEEDVRHARDIKMMVSMLRRFNASHVYRRGNRVADKFAEMGYEMSKPSIWPLIPPIEVLQLLYQDAKNTIPRKKK